MKVINAVSKIWPKLDLTLYEFLGTVCEGHVEVLLHRRSHTLLAGWVNGVHGVYDWWLTEDRVNGTIHWEMTEFGDIDRLPWKDTDRFLSRLKNEAVALCRRKNPQVPFPHVPSTKSYYW